jgi:hypothetical protein
MLWSFLTLVVAIVGIMGLRSSSKRVRIAFDLACLAALSVVLYRARVTPLFDKPLESADTANAWLRATTVAWWLLATSHERDCRP